VHRRPTDLLRGAVIRGLRNSPEAVRLADHDVLSAATTWPCPDPGYWSKRTRFIQEVSLYSVTASMRLSATWKTAP
jgi:hypothetical protein